MFAITRRLLPSLHQSRAFSASALRANLQADASKGEKTIYDKLTAKFAPSELKVQDVSGGCGTFYAIVISSSQFKGLPIVKQHRLVTETLKAEIEGIHGLQIKTDVPQ
ncbi:bola protein [Panaeolus papilionaceus]|nr:bola protein [Panaeolus papilionaceus]